MTEPGPVFGLMAEFVDAASLVRAARRARHAGYRRMDGFAPYPVEELPEALGCRRSPLPALVLIAGILGAGGGYFMQWYAMVVDYPLNVGGRPLHSWPACIPVAFEFMILAAALAALIGWLGLSGLPRLHHPVFNVPEFERASTDRFFLCIEARDALYEAARTRAFLEGLGAVAVKEVAL
jgi:hypothetical protein